MSKTEMPAIRYDERKKRWRMDARDQGRRKTFYSTKPNEKAVQADMKKQLFNWKAGDDLKSDMRLLKAWEAYLAQTKTSTSVSTYRQREQIGRMYIIPALKIKKVSDITKADWQKCINDAYDVKKLSRKSLQNIRGTISNFCSYAADDRIISDAEIPRLKIPHQTKKGVRKILQPDELNRLLSEAPDPFYINVFQFIAQTGLRRGEACGLMWTDIKTVSIKDKKLSLLSIGRSIDEKLNITPGKTDHAQRSFILPDDTVNLLMTHRNQLAKHNIISPWIFPHTDGNMLSPNILSIAWTRFRDAHEYNSSLHELRHTFSSMNQAAMPLSLLQRILGHSSGMDTYGVYGHEVDGELLEAQKIVNGVLRNIKNDVKVTVKRN